MLDGEKKTIPIFLSILSSLFSNVSFADCTHWHKPEHQRQNQTVYKEQFQSWPRASAPTKQGLEDRAKAHS